MFDFDAAMRKAEETSQPVAEALAVQVTGSLSAEDRTALWEKYNFAAVEERPGDWYICRLPAGGWSLGQAWQAARELQATKVVKSAEPQLLTTQPVLTGSDARQRFDLWGKASDSRVAEIEKASDKNHLHWSLLAMNLCEENGTGGAWAAWRKKHPGKEPGEGALVAHPDTGYTPNPRLKQAFLSHADNPELSGVNFVERDKPDARDPLNAPRLLDFPGHGTATASVIAGSALGNDNPWGVAPGAKVLPLRVSSSVVHLSFMNVCDAFDEAIAQNADVISMSLGGPAGSDRLSDRVRAALDHGIIIVSAAGNYLPTVVFPAKLPGVLACAASNALTGPWRFSGMGEEVAISAPGELVWHDTAFTGTGTPPAPVNGSGTSFAVANVAGLAALWVSYHGGRAGLKAIYGDVKLIPFGFRHALTTASTTKTKVPEFIKGGGFGVGIVNAEKMLAVPPDPEAARKLRDQVLSAPTHGIISFPISSWWSILTLPTLTEDGPVLPDAQDGDTRTDQLNAFLAKLLGTETHEEIDLAELGVLASADAGLSNALAQVTQAGRNCVSDAALRRYLLRNEPTDPEAPGTLSPDLRGKLIQARKAAREKWLESHKELAVSVTAATPVKPMSGTYITGASYSIPTPRLRRLRAYAFDPSLATTADSAVNEITIPVVFEENLKPGPVGDYLAVVDVDPASNCAYAPVDLNHPYILAQDGLPRSEGNPQFHQQMVYAVAMKTIRHFEDALGRPIFWSPVRPWDGRGGDRRRKASPLTAGQEVPDTDGPVGSLPEPGAEKDDVSDQFVRRLRLYPHALRAQNAFYSPQKRAILFGYFPASDSDPGAAYPGGVVFTCLAHDIIAHEMTHAILDGMHYHFSEPSNPDVFAFHEAFADIVALFQRFTYPELLRSQIAHARGRLDTGTLMTNLARQFGLSTGKHGALRDALGRLVEQRRERAATEFRDRPAPRAADGGPAAVTIADAARDTRNEESRFQWKRFRPDAALVARVEEPHERGAFLVAAVFDAYLRIYDERIADLRRIATGGTGVLPDGDLHPDLVNRLADEAAKAATHVLRMCIRAMDYVPPTDITFGEFLRALITADIEVVPDDDRRYRAAFIEAFRNWGIYPRDVRTLSEESLRWSPPADGPAPLFGNNPAFFDNDWNGMQDALRATRAALLDWQPGSPRGPVFDQIKKAQRLLHDYFKQMPPGEERNAFLRGIDTECTFHVTNLRPARRIGPNGEFVTEMVVEVLQSADALPSDPEAAKKERARRARMRRTQEDLPEKDRVPFRGGVTLIVEMSMVDKPDAGYRVKYAIYKRPDSATRAARQRAFLLGADSGNPDAAEYSTQGLPAGWYSNPKERAAWQEIRDRDAEAMRASSCGCRRSDMLDAEDKEAREAAEKANLTVGNAIAEPFAFLHS